MKQHRFGPGPLLDGNGNLREPGYSTELSQTYDRTAIRASRLRIKEWDYYLITNDRFGIALTIDDNGYMGLLSASVIDFAKRTETTVSPMFWFPMGKTGMPASSKTGDVRKTLKNAFGAFEHTDEGRRLSFRIDRFSDGKPFSCEILLSDEPKDSMVIATPWPDAPKAFYYNQKINCMRAEGKMVYDDQEYLFSPATAFAVLDWGRGVWTYDNTWYWGTCSTRIDGAPFGFNLGYGFSDRSSASENALFYRGRLHKLEEVTFGIPEDGKGSPDYTAPWTVTSSDGRFEAVFMPIIDRKGLIDLKLFVSDQHQVFGKMSGKAVLDDGTEVRIKDGMCFAEIVHNRY